MKEIKTWPTMRKGKKYWAPRIMTDEDGSIYRQTITFRELKDGSMGGRRESKPYQVKGKNIGKSNETTPLQQAESEIESMIEKKRDKGYHLLGEEPPEILLRPMLAHRYDKRGHDILFPCYTQPKLDGVRMLTDGEKAWTRQGKEYKPKVVNHILEELDVPNGVILDGELILPKEYTFQQTVSAVKKYNSKTKHLKYWVFDLHNKDNPNTTFTERQTLLKAIVNGLDSIIPVMTDKVESEEELYEMHATYDNLEYEGTMVRNMDSPYQPDKRSKHLQKLKKMQTEEFKIVDVIDGDGAEDGLAIFVCVTPDGETFNCRPEGTHKQRAEWFQNKSGFIAKPLTVRFQEYTDDGIPRFPVGVVVRDYE